MKNEIYIHTDKGQYVGGEVIYGTVFLSIHQPIQARAVRLEIKGFEKVWWQDTKTETYQEDGQTKTRTVHIDRHSSRDFFKSQFDVTSYPGGFPVGQFSYPFRYHLPDSLPGVFVKKNTAYRAKISYSIKGWVDIPWAHDLKTKQHLVIHEKLDLAIQPKHHRKEQTVRTLCCIPRGPVRAEAWMNKNAYCAGETAQVHVCVDNSSSVEMSSFNTKLIREIRLRDHAGHFKTIRDVVCQQKYSGTAPQTRKESDCPLPLVSKKGHYIQPSTAAKYIQCEYFVMIELDIPWAPDLEIYSPVVIYSPQSQSWANWQAPAWTTTAVQQVVNPDLAVPLEILNQMTGVFHNNNQHHHGHHSHQASLGGGPVVSISTGMGTGYAPAPPVGYVPPPVDAHQPPVISGVVGGIEFNMGAPNGMSATMKSDVNGITTSTTNYNGSSNMGGVAFEWSASTSGQENEKTGLLSGGV